MASRNFENRVAMAVSDIILRESVPGLGAEADIVKVRKGYARNYLIPKGKAYEVTPANLKRLNLLKIKRAQREAAELSAAEEFAHKINKTKLEFILETGETGKAFGSVTAKDIEDKLRTDFGIVVDRHKIELDRPIKESGEKQVSIKLHHQVSATLKVEIRSTVPPPPPPRKVEPSEARPKRKPKSAA
jgi:large subunit ribosomal protein L9